MRALLLTGSLFTDMAPPHLAEEQIIAGPDWPDDQTVDGYWRSLRTPVGEYDLAETLAKIPAEQKPDVVVCLTDTTGRGLPRNVAAFPGRKVLLVADAPFTDAPGRDAQALSVAETYDRIVFLSELVDPSAGQPGAAT